MNNNRLLDFVGTVMVIAGSYVLGHMNGYKKGVSEGKQTITNLFTAFAYGAESELKKESIKQEESK